MLLLAALGAECEASCLYKPLYLLIATPRCRIRSWSSTERSREVHRAAILGAGSSPMLVKASPEAFLAPQPLETLHFDAQMPRIWLRGRTSRGRRHPLNKETSNASFKMLYTLATASWQVSSATFGRLCDIDLVSAEDKGQVSLWRSHLESVIYGDRITCPLHPRH